jgi:hypothetical protein
MVRNERVELGLDEIISLITKSLRGYVYSFNIRYS